MTLFITQKEMVEKYNPTCHNKNYGLRKLKFIILFLAKYSGFFWISKNITSNGLRIICYHGFSKNDEHLFRPHLFMTKSLFRKRLSKIYEMGFSVISLDKAVNMMRSGIDCNNSLVLTIDDGWQGVDEIAWPLLKEYDFDWTLYLTTYYSKKQIQVMNIAIQYLLWKTPKNHIDLSDFVEIFNDITDKHGDLDLDELAFRLNKFGESLPTSEERQKFLGKIASCLDVCQHDIEKKHLFYLLEMGTIKRMHELGVDIQLHTHRHSLGGADKNKLQLEIADNRKYIGEVCSHNPVHFCYPSGLYQKEHLEWLSENGVVSATTCKPGLNYSTTPLLELRRFLDGENISEIEFEAELSGFLELCRKLRSALRVPA